MDSINSVEEIQKVVEELNARLTNLKSKKEFFKQVYSENEYKKTLKEIEELEEEVIKLVEIKERISKYSDQYEYEKILLLSDEELTEMMTSEKEKVLFEVKRSNDRLNKEIENIKKRLEETTEEIKRIANEINDKADLYANPNNTDEEKANVLSQGKELGDKLERLVERKETLEKEIKVFSEDIIDEDTIFNDVSVEEYRKNLISKLSNYTTDKTKFAERSAVAELIYEFMHKGGSAKEFMDKFNKITDKITYESKIFEHKALIDPRETVIASSSMYIGAKDEKKKFHHNKGLFSDLKEDGETLEYLINEYEIPDSVFSTGHNIYDILNTLLTGTDKGNYPILYGLNNRKEDLSAQLDHIKETKDNPEYNALKQLKSKINNNQNVNDYNKITQHINETDNELFSAIPELEEYYTTLTKLVSINELIELTKKEIKDLRANTSFFGKGKREEEIRSLESKIRKEEFNYSEVAAILESLNIIDKINDRLVGIVFQRSNKDKLLLCFSTEEQEKITESATNDIDALLEIFENKVIKTKEDINKINELTNKIKQLDNKSKEEYVREIVGDIPLTEEQIDAYFANIKFRLGSHVNEDWINNVYENMQEYKYLTGEKARAKKDIETARKNNNVMEEVQDIESNEEIVSIENLLDETFNSDEEDTDEKSGGTK